jgi:hypothetical protein
MNSTKVDRVDRLRRHFADERAVVQSMAELAACFDAHFPGRLLHVPFELRQNSPRPQSASSVHFPGPTP